MFSLRQEGWSMTSTLCERVPSGGVADRAVCVTVFGAAKMAGKCSNNQLLGCVKNQDCGSGGTCVLPTNNMGPPRCYTCGNSRPTRCDNSQAVACTSQCSVAVAT